jgi:hypothetical protein
MPESIAQYMTRVSTSAEGLAGTSEVIHRLLVRVNVETSKKKLPRGSNPGSRCPLKSTRPYCDALSRVRFCASSLHGAFFSAIIIQKHITAPTTQIKPIRRNSNKYEGLLTRRSIISRAIQKPHRPRRQESTIKSRTRAGASINNAPETKNRMNAKMSGIICDELSYRYGGNGLAKVGN